MDTRRVIATDQAVDLIEKLKVEHGQLMFHQSGGCFDGSSPMWFPKGEFITGGSDVFLGGIVGW